MSSLCFAGSLSANLARNVPLETAIPRAIVCASLSVTKKGAQASYPALADLRALQERTYEESPTEETTSLLCPPTLAEAGAVDSLMIRATLGI